MLEHPENMPCPNVFTEFGITNDSRFLHPLKARAPMLLRLFPMMVTVLRLTQLRNASCEIAFTVSGIVT